MKRASSYQFKIFNRTVLWGSMYHKMYCTNIELSVFGILDIALWNYYTLDWVGGLRVVVVNTPLHFVVIVNEKEKIMLLMETCFAKTNFIVVTYGQKIC